MKPSAALQLFLLLLASAAHPQPDAVTSCLHAAQAGDLDQGPVECDRALRLHPRSATAHLARGTLRILDERLPGALADFTLAVELEPDYADAHVGRATVYYLLGERAFPIQVVTDLVLYPVLLLGTVALLT